MGPEAIYSIINLAVLFALLVAIFKIIDWGRETRKAAEEARDLAREALAESKKQQHPCCNV